MEKNTSKNTKQTLRNIFANKTICSEDATMFSL